MAKQHRITAEEIKFIQDQCLKMADHEIAAKLDRDIKTIRRTRKKLGIVKGGKKIIHKDIAKKIKNNEKVPKTVLLATQKLTEDEKRGFFEKEFKNSVNYQILKRQFTDEEIQFYIEEWTSLCVQFEDILATEKRQLEELIKSEIIGNRIMSYVKTTEDYIAMVQKEIDEFRSRNDLTVEENQKRDEQMVFAVQKMGSVSSAMTNDYHKNLDVRNKLFENLNSRRKDRIDQLKKSGMTFAGIVQALRDRETRTTQGRHMELVKLAQTKKMEEFRRPVIFPDGTKSCILLDDKSLSDSKSERLLMNDDTCLLIYEINQFTNKNILILENDVTRIQKFQDIFNNQNIVLAHSVSNALDKIGETQFDLVCLDYDLNVGEKADAFVHHILTNDMLESAKFVIHSMNQDGSKLLNDLLIGKRIVEVFPFEKFLRKTIGVENA